MFKRSLVAVCISIVLLALLTVVANSCNSPSENEDKQPQTSNLKSQTDSVETDEIQEPGELPEVNDSLTDIARFIAGIMPEKSARLKKLAKDSTWKKYASFIDLQWKKFERDRLVFMDTFARENLKFEGNNKNVFYPFSGPDLLHAVTFFPQADTVVMIALEPPGTLSIIHEKKLADSLPQYFASMRQSLHAILNWSFFITKKMFNDLRQEELNGTIHLLLWFAIHRNYEVADIKPATITNDGKLYVASSAKDTVYQNRKTKGVYLSLVKDGHAVNVFYYSADLGDWGIKANKPFKTMLENYSFSASFVKSASYLMHSENFNMVRNMILDRSQMHLQDDSGVRWKLFAARKEWKPYLFGTYKGHINLFKQYSQQTDLMKAYDSLQVQKLHFGIGYKHRKEESTLMLFKRKEQVVPQVKSKTKSE